MKIRLQQLLQKQVKLATVCVIVVIVSFFWACYYTAPSASFFSERGTYDYKVNESNPVMIWMSVDWANGAFWYTDQAADYYIVGTVEEHGKNHYWFRCKNEDSKAIIPDQLMTRHNNDEFTLMIGNEIRQFEKGADYIITHGDYEYK